MARPKRCTAKTKSTGKRCTRWAIEGTPTCSQHTEVAEEPVASVTTLATRRQNKTKAKRGRPSLFGPERAAAIIECLNLSMTFRLTAYNTGVSIQTISAWIARGRRIQAEVEQADWDGREYVFAEGDEEFLRFYGQATEAMSAKAKAGLKELFRIAEHGKSETDRIRAITWFLERTDEQFVPLQRSVIDAQMTTVGGGGEPIKVIIGISEDSV